MSNVITKIDSIKKMAVFQDFQWDSSLRDDQNNVATFKKVNIFYGRNYSGKTTLSRIVRALETGTISDNLGAHEFQLSFHDGSITTQHSLTSCGNLVRVFNKDFVKDNLRFIVDENESINAFAILGKDNAELEQEIKRHEAELGSEEDKSGLLGKQHAAQDKFFAEKKAYDDRLSTLERKYREKAVNRQTGIKYNRSLDVPNYDVRSIRKDIDHVRNGTFTPLANDQITGFQNLLREEPKPEIPESLSLDLQYSGIVSKAKMLVEKRIHASNPIQELLNDAVLAEWVRIGREYHKGKRDTCAFCGSDLSPDLWNKLDKHFNEESENLRQELDGLIGLIERERLRVLNLLKIKRSDFYSKFTADLESLEERLSTQIKYYRASLDSIKEQVEKRTNDIFTPLSLDEPESGEDPLNAVRDSFEKIRTESNKLTASLRENQSSARQNLRLHEVYTFVKDINYEDESTAINALAEERNEAEITAKTAKENVDTKSAKINELKAQLIDESKGADRVNDYLNDFFGHQFLSLKAIDGSHVDLSQNELGKLDPSFGNTEEYSGSTSSVYRFEVTRNGEKAFNLSEGECSLIAFCYFMAKLEDVETKGNQPIIWIDDPVSSLDANHIFFVYSLINAKIATPEKNEEGATGKGCERFNQLFISTHNLDFLKYLKRLHGNKKNGDFQYFIIYRTGQESAIRLMPPYLKRYITEFNFLFHQIYKCAQAQIDRDEDHDCYYNFGNNTRKFLEAFLYYKYPNALRNDNKLERFFGNDPTAASLTYRINNEYSHLEGLVERGISPIDVPEMKSLANFILRKIKAADFDQYSAFLESIGAPSDG